MRNTIASLVALLLLGSGVAYAVTNETQYNLEDQTSFGKVNAAGGSQTGNPGYISLQAPTTAASKVTYYLWVNGVGKLCMASYPVISAFASFPSGNWNDQTNGMGCTVVGGQS